MNDGTSSKHEFDSAADVTWYLSSTFIGVGRGFSVKCNHSVTVTGARVGHNSLMAATPALSAGERRIFDKLAGQFVEGRAFVLSPGRPCTVEIVTKEDGHHEIEVEIVE